MLRYIVLASLLVALIGGKATAATSPQPVVLELFTSQGCSSCPPADALLKRLAAEDPSLLPLSFHIHYWDNLGWKDPYSSADNTARQKAYARAMKENGIFTPQLIVDGAASVIGSDENAVRGAIAAARKTPSAVDVTITRVPVSGDLNVTVSDDGHPIVNGTFDVVEIHFNPYAKTSVEAGENGGRTLESIANVTSIKNLESWSHGKKTYIIPASSFANYDVAVLVQNPQEGRILGAACYLKP